MRPQHVPVVCTAPLAPNSEKVSGSRRQVGHQKPDAVLLPADSKRLVKVYDGLQLVKPGIHKTEARIQGVFTGAKNLQIIGQAIVQELFRKSRFYWPQDSRPVL